jgi:serine/threonine protein phosphatase PrpC
MTTILNNTNMIGQPNKRYSIYFKTFKNGSTLAPNQDSFFAWFKDCDKVEDDHLESPTPYSVYGVFDGHGALLNIGGKLSIIASKYMNLEIPKRWKSININPLKSIYLLFNDLNDLLFQKLHEILVEEKDNVQIITKTIYNGTERKYIEYTNIGSNKINKCRGGCTASVTFILDNSIIINAHVGDSDTYILTNDNIIPLFEKHSPDSILERNRVINEYGTDEKNHVKFIYDTINKLSRPHIYNKTTHTLIDPNKLSNNGHSLYFKNVSNEFASIICTPDYEASLAMTRSLGDFYIGTFGCSSEPTIIHSKLEENMTLIIGSDGVWDNWKITKFKDFLYSNNFHKIFDKSVELAKTNFGSSHDDITLLQFVTVNI